MTTRRAFNSALLATGLALPVTGLAHREKATHSDIVWTGEALDITHSFHRHDFESALSVAGMLDRPELDTLRARALAAIHVEETFRVSADGEDIPVETLGAEGQGNRLYVYQQAPLPALPTELEVEAWMLRSLWSDQVNNVDVRINGEVRSLRFARDDTAKRVELA